MRVEPANIDQVREAEDGSYVSISADVGTVAGEIKRVGCQGLGVRLALTQKPFFHVFHEWHDGCPHNGDTEYGPNSTYLVTTVKAHQNSFGVYEGLDQRIVDRILEIGHSSYDYATALKKHNEAVKRAQRQDWSSRVAEVSEFAAHALRKDTGARYKGRTFVPRDAP